MNNILTIQERLKDLRVEKQLSLDQLAKQTGISRSALASYESDEYKEISMYSIKTLATFYHVSTDYLLCMTENRQFANAEVSELHLSDGAIDALKRKTFNTRLLSEMIAHKDFPKLMVDIEIYVDGVAAMQIQNLNASIDKVRVQIEQQYNPSAFDLHRCTLESAHIDEDRYFAMNSHNDLDRILSDIKATHKYDSNSAPAYDRAKKMMKEMLELMKMEKTPEEKRVVLLCWQLHIKYEKLTEVEKIVMIDVLKKSGLMNKPLMPHGRGRR